ncbi:hypothetical protein ACFFGR_16885 [Arthrobacter liuii]|uniref:Uncharacterized protein n=1 Tax=Arthrobacter liuii TaxID=1476996 RepID=A0ABQ2B213_9MICC|nr:hypothetical protein [Arthrobacter liuii]GGI02768.1 hypothetical protein GCM10007170_45260 [Arthrobacter liuii]
MSHFDDFLREATSSDPGSEKGLSAEELHGLYTSWCIINVCPAESAEALWAALTSRGILPGNNTLAMTGPAAADYSLSSEPISPDSPIPEVELATGPAMLRAWSTPCSG